MTATVQVQWDAARLMFHTLRDTDRDTALFKCFVCNCWFDGQQQMDRNFNHISTEVQICPIAQAMMFGC